MREAGQGKFDPLRLAVLTPRPPAPLALQAPTLRLPTARPKPAPASRSDAGRVDADLDAQSVLAEATDSSVADSAVARADSAVASTSPDASTGCTSVRNDPACAQRCPETCNGQDDDCDGQT